MITNPFLTNYRKLNNEQKRAVDEIEGAVMVVAGPGTGKTQILTLRIANILLKTQVNPENILALTFSDSAARQMRNRLLQIIGTQAYRVELTTFHSFANSIIQNFPEEFEGLLNSINMTEVEQIEILENILSKNEFNKIKPMGEVLYYLRPLLRAINDLKKEGVMPEELKLAIDEWRKEAESVDDLYHDKGKYVGEMKGKYVSEFKDIEKTEELAKVYELYQQSLAKEKKYDFNDMLLQVVKVLEKNQGLLLILQEKYQYFLVDEHQDTNKSQNKLVELLASFYDNPNIFVVGDEKQAIFRFQGASLENFFHFKKLYPNAKIISLKKNYRSHQIILNAAHSLIEKNISSAVMFENVIKLEAVSKDSLRKVSIMVGEKPIDELSGVAENIAQKIKEGTQLKNIAVLGRQNRDLTEMQQALQRKQIQGTLISDNDLLTDPDIQKIIELLRLIENPLDEKRLVRIMHFDCFNIEPFDIYRLLSQARKERLNLLNFLTTLKEKEAKTIGIESFKPIKNFLISLKSWQKISVNQGLEKLYLELINSSGILRLSLLKPNRYEVLAKINGLLELIKQRIYVNPEFGLSDFLKFIEITQEHNLSLRTSGVGFEADTVKLLTAHKSKGLEFDYIYIIGAFDGHWGNRKKRGGNFKIPWERLQVLAGLEVDEIEDERRLFYVAMTRARFGVAISYSKMSLEQREQLPSQFIEELDKKMIEQVDLKSISEDQGESLGIVEGLKIGPKDQKFIKQLFLERGLSASGLDNYLKCPFRWFFRNLLQIPEEKTPALIYGSAVHKALEGYIKSFKKSKVGVEVLLKGFEEEIEKQLFWDPVLKKKLIKQGQESLKSFYQSTAKNWKEDILSEQVIKGVKIGEGIVLNGQIDMVEPIDRKGNVLIHDFKTGKPKRRNLIDGSDPESKYPYFRQLIFYKLLLDSYKNGLFKGKNGVVDFVDPDEKGKTKTEQFEITNKDTEELKKQILIVGEQIINLDFWQLGCGEKNCEYCMMKNTWN